MSGESDAPRSIATEKRRWQTPEVMDAPVDEVTATQFVGGAGDGTPFQHNS